MDAPLWVTILAAVLGSTTLTTIITAFRDRKKVSADTARVLTDIAGELVSDVREEYTLLRARYTDLKDRLEKSEERELLALQRASAHDAWDSMIQTRLSEAGITVPPPPSLFPVP